MWISIKCLSNRIAIIVLSTSYRHELKMTDLHVFLSQAQILSFRDIERAISRRFPDENSQEKLLLLPAPGEVGWQMDFFPHLGPFLVSPSAVEPRMQ